MEQSAKKTYEVLIAGQPLKLRSSHDEKTVEELVTLVDEKINEALSKHGNVSYQSSLLLASLHLAEDYIMLKKSAAEKLNELENKANGILTRLETSPLTNLGPGAN